MLEKADYGAVENKIKDATASLVKDLGLEYFENQRKITIHKKPTGAISTGWKNFDQNVWWTKQGRTNSICWRFGCW